MDLDDLEAAVGESSEQHRWTDDDNVAVLRALLRDPDIKNNGPAVHALADQIGTTYTSVWRTIENFRGLRSGRPTPGQTNTSASQRRVWERWGTTPWHQLPTPVPPPRTPEEQAHIDAVVAARMEERRRNR